MKKQAYFLLCFMALIDGCSFTSAYNVNKSEVKITLEDLKIIDSNTVNANVFANAQMHEKYTSHFDFSNGFYTNLHLFLFEMARQPHKLSEVNWINPLTTKESEQLLSAINVYQNIFLRTKRSAHIDSELINIKSMLYKVNEDNVFQSLSVADPIKLAINQSSAIYRTKLWASHQSSNQQWISRLQSMLALYGKNIEQELNTRLESNLFEQGNILVDVAYYVGVFAGAYTTNAPAHIVISSSDKKYQGYAALEMLYHEATHAYATNKLDQLVEQELSKLKQTNHNRLWHTIQFLLVGQVVEAVLSNTNIDYQMYFLANGVGQRTRYSAQVNSILAIIKLPVNVDSNLEQRVNRIIRIVVLEK